MGANAQGAVLIVINGEHGPGFSCQCEPGALLTLPHMLRIVADQIENDFKKGQF